MFEGSSSWLTPRTVGNALIVSGTLFLAACGGGGLPAADAGGRDGNGTDAASDGPADAPDGPSSPPEPGMHRRVTSADGRTRVYHVYVPRSYDPSGVHPVLLVFHGGTGSVEALRRVGFEPRADEAGVIVVYPEGLYGNWNDGRSTTDAARNGVDDVAFIATMLDELAGWLRVDASRIWATGASNGGMFCHRLACDLSERFAAVAPVIAALPSELRPRCRPTHPLSMLAIQGTADPFITFEGGDAAHDRFPRLGDGGPIESAAETMAFWAEQLRCESQPPPETLPPVDPDDPTRVTLHRFRDCDGSAMIDYYVVEGMGHTWPPLPPRDSRISGPTSPQLDATAVIWEFFHDAPTR